MLEALSGEGIENEFSSPGAVGYHSSNQFNRFGSGMKFAHRRPIDFEHGVLSPVAIEIVRAVFDPAVQYWFMSVVVVAFCPTPMIVFTHTRQCLDANPSIFQTLHEVLEEH